VILSADIRFKSSGTDVVAATGFALPVVIEIDRPDAETALADARRVAERLRSESSAAEVLGGRVELIDPATRSKVTVEQRSRREVRLELTL